MSDEKRMTAEREQKLRAHVTNGTMHYGADEVFAELDATRADLAELVAALPKCSFPGCTAHATRTDINCENVCDDIKHGAYMSLDPAHPEGPSAEYDLPWAPLLRRLAERSKR